ncbi:MAG: SDR family NAD(P)-dependent oxidoreductase [Lachnospiraceae bacterium]
MMDAGAEVLLLGRREAVLKEVVSHLGEHASYRVADITEYEKLPDLIREIEEQFPIDILVNNAGINLKGPFLEYTPKELTRLWQFRKKQRFLLPKRLQIIW